MKYRYIKICGLLAACFFMNACATALTVLAPPMKEVVLEEERTAGREISTNYRLIERTKDCTLLKQPYCMETAKEKIILKKRLHGVIPALVEIPLYGLGLLDLVAARQYSKYSAIEEMGQVVETGSIMECGDFEPAVDAELVVQCAETGVITRVKTDSSGEISVDSLAAGFLQNSQLNVFVKEGHCFAYITTLDSSGFY